MTLPILPVSVMTHIERAKAAKVMQKYVGAANPLAQVFFLDFELKHML